MASVGNLTAKNEKMVRYDGPTLPTVRSGRSGPHLIGCRLLGLKGRRKPRTDALQGGDDRNRDTRGDQPILDSHCTRLVSGKASNQSVHRRRGPLSGIAPSGGLPAATKDARDAIVAVLHQS